MTASAERGGTAGQRSQQQSDRERQLSGSRLFSNSLPRNRSGNGRGLRFVSLSCVSPPFAAFLRRFASFCPVSLLNDCDQATLIILTGFLQFDEYVDGSVRFCALDLTLKLDLFEERGNSSHCESETMFCGGGHH